MLFFYDFIQVCVFTTNHHHKSETVLFLKNKHKSFRAREWGQGSQPIANIKHKVFPQPIGRKAVGLAGAYERLSLFPSFRCLIRP